MLRHPGMHVIGRKPVHFLAVNFEVLDRPVADVFELESIAWGVLELARVYDVGVPLLSRPALNALSRRYPKVTSRPLSDACLMASTKRCTSTAVSKVGWWLLPSWIA
jgi:hypothetical protein